MALQEQINNGVNPDDRPSTTSKVWNKVIIGAVILAFLGVGLLLSWALTNNDPLDIKNAPFPTRTIREHPTAGGVVILDTDYCKNTDKEGDLRISFVSPSREIFLPVTRERGPKGCNKGEIPVLIPKDIPADTYKIKFRVTYDINPLKQNVVEEFESQPVVVDESAGNPDRNTQLKQ